MALITGSGSHRRWAAVDGSGFGAGTGASDPIDRGKFHCYAATGLWPTGGQTERSHWATLCRAVDHPLTPRRDTLIALRGLGLDEDFTHPCASRRAYDDTFVWFGGDGSVRRFAGATYAHQASSAGMGDDIDGDGKQDISTIRPGRYVAASPHFFHGKVALRLFNLQGGREIPTWRDVDHDRGISARDRQASLEPTHGGQVKEDGACALGIKIHPGWDTRHTEGMFSSVGCQTATLAEVRKLYEVGDFDYVLIDAVEALVAIGRLRR